MTRKFTAVLAAMVLLCAFTACDDDIEPKQITYAVHSGTDDLAVFVWDGSYRDDNKCIPDNIRRVPAKNGVYEFTTWGMPGSPVVMFIVQPPGTRKEAKAVITINGVIAHRSNVGKDGSVLYSGSVDYPIKKETSVSRNICSNPLMAEFE